MDKYWTYRIGGGEIVDAEHPTRIAAETAATEAFAEEMVDTGDGYESESLDLIEFSYDDYGEREKHNMIKTYVQYEPAKSDFAEHNVWHKGAGGVL